MEMTDGLSDLYLNFYGCIVKVSSDERTCLDNVRRDFLYFLCSQPPEKPLSVSIRLHKEPPPPVPAQAKQVFQTNEGVCYEYEQIRYVDYSGKALARYDFRSEEGVGFSLDDSLLYEISYIMVLSRIGELLDRKGIHRLHSLAVSVDRFAVICLLPMGGGKTTLALELIKANDCFLLSDEIAAIDGSLQVLPFPLRLGVTTTERIDPNMPGRYLRSITRIAYGPKVLIDVEYFIQKVATEPARLGVVLFGERKNSNKPELKRLSKFAALYHVLKYITLGYQLPQTKAYFFKFSIGYFITLFTILLSRLLSGVKIALSVKCYRFKLADNPHKNAQVIASVLRKNGS
ncbi:hypothetical protein [Candidatus Methylomirabilis sp.]|uniref:hypothetical protein n=1 Tax=Candidatus Methylomirabilis sp. TaxID=2032687 RepID=UPI002A6904ED|nr:hypothetical protein [Candidatus Methylomirabilis sp.]